MDTDGTHESPGGTALPAPAGRIGRAPVGMALWGTEPVRTVAHHARRAEEAGFESIWLVDTQLICRELYVTLAACALATERLHLATGVTVPKTRHPSVTASALATLQELAGGRVLAGISTGHSALRNIGEHPARIDELARYVATVRDLLAGRDVRLGPGVDGALSWMSGPAAVPLHIAATGPRLTRAAAGIGDGVLLLRGAADDLLTQGIELVAQGAAAAGRTAGSVAVTAWVYVGIDDDPSRAYDQVRARVAAVLRLTDPATVEGEEREVVERVRRAYDMSAHAESMPAHAALVPEHLLDRYAIAGDATTVRARLDALVRDPRIDRVVVSPQIGGAAVPITGAFIDRFATAVLPGLGAA